MRTRHTPGPWRVLDGAPGPNDVVLACVESFAFDALEVVATVDVFHDDPRPNARLIAAAPDLLEALKDILDRFEHERDIQLGNGSPDDYTAIEAAKAAIAKAEDTP